ncbi:MAG TPA: type II toxin-antitoxin system PemK/MazF family toxin [Dehalococcoidia bacterium]|jgi:mRNA interferase MazF|nr:type II toxin-antitoxin system PemK/MazF family toxin [Dehalococcoidia bacterium]
MNRGEIWTVAGGGDYTGKPRPVVILQDDRFLATRSVTVCGFTTNPADIPLVRIRIEPSELNGLDEASRVMADKITTVRRSRLAKRIGQLTDEEMTSLERAILVFLGFAGDSPAPEEA